MDGIFMKFVLLIRRLGYFGKERMRTKPEKRRKRFGMMEQPVLHHSSNSQKQYVVFVQ